MLQPIVDLQGIGVRIGDTPILRNLTLSVAPGEVVGLIGSNGSGKTTLLRVVATLLPPTEGAGTVLGAPLGARIRHGGFVIGLAVSAGFILFYYICLIGGEQLSDRMYLPPLWAMWAANIVLGILGAWVFVRTNQERSLVPEPFWDLWRRERT